MFDIRKLYPYWRTYQEMSIVRTSSLFSLMRNIEGFHDGALVLFDLLIFSCSSTGLTFVLDQYFEYEEVNKIMAKIEKHHMKKIKKIQQSIKNGAGAHNFESALKSSMSKIAGQVEYHLRNVYYNDDSSETLDDTADNALMYLFDELGLDYYDVEDSMKGKLISAMKRVIHFTIEDCKNYGIVSSKISIKDRNF